MKIEIDAKVRHWWIEMNSKGCNVMIRWEADSPEKGEKKLEFRKEKEFKTIKEAAAWLEEQLGDDK